MNNLPCSDAYSSSWAHKKLRSVWRQWDKVYEHFIDILEVPEVLITTHRSPLHRHISQPPHIRTDCPLSSPTWPGLAACPNWHGFCMSSMPDNEVTNYKKFRSPTGKAFENDLRGISAMWEVFQQQCACSTPHKFGRATCFDHHSQSTVTHRGGRPPVGNWIKYETDLNSANWAQNEKNCTSPSPLRRVSLQKENKLNPICCHWPKVREMQKIKIASIVEPVHFLIDCISRAQQFVAVILLSGALT